MCVHQCVCSTSILAGKRGTWLQLIIPLACVGIWVHTGSTVSHQFDLMESLFQAWLPHKYPWYVEFVEGRWWAGSHLLGYCLGADVYVSCFCLCVRGCVCTNTHEFHTPWNPDLGSSCNASMTKEKSTEQKYLLESPYCTVFLGFCFRFVLFSSFP